MFRLVGRSYVKSRYRCFHEVMPILIDIREYVRQLGCPLYFFRNILACPNVQQRCGPSAGLGDGMWQSDAQPRGCLENGLVLLTYFMVYETKR